MTELEAQLLQIIEEQQTQLLEQQHSLEVMQTKVMNVLSVQSKVIETIHSNLQQTQKSLATMQKQFHEVQQNTTKYTEQINGKVREISKITANNEEVLERISTTQHSVSSQVAKAQQNLLENDEGKYIIDNDKNLKNFIYALQERYYTTLATQEKRLAQAFITTP